MGNKEKKDKGALSSRGGSSKSGCSASLRYLSYQLVEHVRLHGLPWKSQECPQPANREKAVHNREKAVKNQDTAPPSLQPPTRKKFLTWDMLWFVQYVLISIRVMEKNENIAGKVLLEKRGCGKSTVFQDNQVHLLVFQGRFSIDLYGTGLSLMGTAKWLSQGNYAVSEIQKSPVSYNFNCGYTHSWEISNCWLLR